MPLCALVTGITGQDGAYLARRLLEHGYQVVGAVRPSGAPDIWRLAELGVADRIETVRMDLSDPRDIRDVLKQVRPDEVYNLAAQSSVPRSFEQPEQTAEINAMGALRLLEALRGVAPDARFYQASSSEMFGSVAQSTQTEETPFRPRSPYAATKLFAHWSTIGQREAYGMFCVSGILFNHDSPLRGPEFLTRKVTLGFARLALGQGEALKLGNLEARRDWGFADDYTEGMHAMMTAETPDDYVLATGRTSSVRDFATLAAAAAGFDLEWTGEGKATQGTDRKSGRALISVDPNLYRPVEPQAMCGDASKARRELGWQPKHTFEQLVELMVEADLRRVRDASA